MQEGVVGVHSLHIKLAGLVVSGIMAAAVPGLAGWVAPDVPRGPQTSAPAPENASGRPGGILGPADVVVFAPHPDDEVLGAGGLIRQAVRARLRVRVVFFTNGDGYKHAAAGFLRRRPDQLGAADYLSVAATRQREAIAAASILGVPASDLVFLAYPDTLLLPIYNDLTGQPLRSPYTDLAATYTAAEPDYHTFATGKPAPYTRAAVLADVESILRQSRPSRVYVTDRTDQHPDHAAAYRFVRDALAASGFRGSAFSYLVHGGQWPCPVGSTPLQPISRCGGTGFRWPAQLSWPAPSVIRLKPSDVSYKMAALSAYASEWPERRWFASWAKSDELFWAIDLGTAT